MIGRGIFTVTASLFLTVVFWSTPGTASEAPEFKELYDLVKEHATGLSEAELNRDAVQGFLSAVGPKVLLVPKSSARAQDGSDSQLVNKVNNFDQGFAYVRVTRV